MLVLVSCERPCPCEENRPSGAIAGVHRKPGRVVQPVVEVPSARVAELAAQPEAAVREGRAVDGKAEHALAGLVAPAQLGGVLRRGGEQEPGLVTELDRDSRRRYRFSGIDAQLDGEGLAGGELLPLLAARPEQADLRDPRLTAPVLAEPGRALLGVALLGEERVVPGDRLLRGPVELDLAVPQQD